MAPIIKFIQILHENTECSRILGTVDILQLCYGVIYPLGVTTIYGQKTIEIFF